MSLDPDDPVVRLCTAGMEAESQGQHDRARSLFKQAWSLRTCALDSCIAAHYMARQQESPEETLWWNEEALRQAKTADPEEIASFLPSLYLNLAHSHETMGRYVEARDLYQSAAAHGSILPEDRYGAIVRQGIERGRHRVAAALAAK